MKKILLISIFFFLMLICFNKRAYTVNELFRSIASGNWNENSIWEMSTDGGTTWIPANSSPSSLSGMTTIQSPDLVTITENVDSDQLKINSGGIIFIDAGVTLTILNGDGTDFFLSTVASVTGSGTLQTQGNVVLLVKDGSDFNVKLKIASDTAVFFNDGSPYVAVVNAALQIDNGAVITTASGAYAIQANTKVINNGEILLQGSSFRMRGHELINNGQISGGNLAFETTTLLSGNGIISADNVTITGSGNISLSSNVTFSGVSNFSIFAGGVLNPNSRTVTFESGIFTLYNGATVMNTGIFQTKEVVYLELRDGSNFNASLKANTGSAVVYNFVSPYVARINGPITIDSGTTFSTFNGGFSVYALNNVVNNGTIIGGSGATFRLFGETITNNGVISFDNFVFSSSNHILQGSGSWKSPVNVNNGVNVVLASNHQISSLNISSGGVFNVSNFKLSVSASNPIINNGTFTTTNSTIEYNGTSLQSISTANVNYNKLRINNSTGSSLTGNETVNDTLSIILGDLNLNGFVLTISPAGYLTETPGNTVNGSAGYITTTRNLNAPSSLNVGGLGAVLTTSSNLGNTEIRRGGTIQNGLNSNTSIERYFDILPANNSGLNATLVFRYDQSELNGKVESSLSLFHSTNSGVTWTLRGGTVNTSSNTITLNAIDAFSRWSASGMNVVAAQLKLIMEGFYIVAANRLRMRDTVRAYFRNNFSPYNIVDSAKSIVDSITFIGSYLFPNASSGTYYIQLKHRNSLETWSKSNGQSYTAGSAFNYDFTTSASQAFGNNMIQKGTKFCLYSGDVNQDGTIDGVDLGLVENGSYNFRTGYVPEDCNGDNIVDGSDALIVDNNAFNFVSVVRP